MLTITREDKDSAFYLLDGFLRFFEHNKATYPEMTSSQIINAFVDNEIAMYEGMQSWFAYEDECAKHNQELLKSIKKSKGNTFYKYLLEIIGSEGMNNKAEIVTEPVGKFQEEKYGRTIKGYWVEQWSQGMEGDSWGGHVCVQLNENEYFKFNYNM